MRERETTGAWGEQGLLGGRWKTLKNVEILNIKKKQIHWWTEAGSKNKGLSPRAIIDNREQCLGGTGFAGRALAIVGKLWKC